MWLPATFVVIRVYDGGAPEAVWCMVSYFVLLTGVIGWRFRSGAWRQIDLTGDAAAPRTT